MKQAILITAYKDIDFLSQIIDMFDHNYTFYIHLDAKGKYENNEIQNIKSNPKTKLLSFKYSIHWGSIDHQKAILLLAEEAIKDRDIEYMHLITGQDFPIKSARQISDFLEKNKGTEFFNADTLPSPKWKGGGLGRVKYYSLYEYFNGRGLGRFPIKALILLQKIFFIKRCLPASLPTLYGGGTYWTLSRNAIEYTLNFLEKHPEVMERFKYTFYAEEILIHSILMNSPFKVKMSRNALRYIEWKHRDGISPANLDERDYNNLVDSDAFFARKFDKNRSKSLLAMVKNKLLR